MIPGGTRIRQYEIKSLIGEGGMGQVYLAVDPAFKKFLGGLKTQWQGFQELR